MMCQEQHGYHDDRQQDQQAVQQPVQQPAQQLVQQQAEHPCVICHHCDLLVTLPVLAQRQKASCPRCHTTLTVCWDAACQRLNAYSLAALFMLLLSVLFPFISMNVAGIHSHITLWQIPQVMLSEHYAGLALLFLLFVLLAPGCCMVMLLLLINPLPLAQKHKVILARLLFRLKSWGMPEIFLAAVLVSFVKLVSYGDIGLGSSFLPLCLFCLLQLRVFQCLDRRWLWQRIAPPPVLMKPCHSGLSALKQGLRMCSCCHAVLPQRLARCPRCHSKGTARRRHSLQWTLALLLSALLLYLPANILPMMNTELLGSKASATILSGVMLLWNEGAYPVALIIFVASILVPCLKMIAIGWLCWYANGKGKQHSALMHRTYAVVEFVGRWSMIDVFVIAVLSALVRIGGLLSVYPASGALLFALVVILTMFSALAFDPRLCWDREITGQHQEKNRHDK